MGEYANHRNWQMIQITSLFLSEDLGIKHLPTHHYKDAHIGQKSTNEHKIYAFHCMQIYIKEKVNI